MTINIHDIHIHHQAGGAREYLLDDVLDPAGAATPAAPVGPLEPDEPVLDVGGRGEPVLDEGSGDDRLAPPTALSGASLFDSLLDEGGGDERVVDACAAHPGGGVAAGDLNDLDDDDDDDDDEDDGDGEAAFYEEGARVTWRLRCGGDERVAFMQLHHVFAIPPMHPMSSGSVLVRCTRPCWPARSLITSRLADGSCPTGSPPPEHSHILIVF